MGHHRCPLFVEGNDGVLTPLTLVAVCDAVRLELASWPGAGDLKPTPCVEGTSPWQRHGRLGGRSGSLGGAGPKGGGLCGAVKGNRGNHEKGLFLFFWGGDESRARHQRLTAD